MKKSLKRTASQMEALDMNIESKLTGKLGERHKILNKLVNNTKDEEFMQQIIQDLSKLKRIDLIYIARLANHTKNAYVICELLKCEDAMVVSVAMQAKWLFTGKTHTDFINFNYFTNNIFRHISRHTLCRLVSNLSAFLQVESIAEEFFKYFFRNGDSTLALKLLPKCSVPFIRQQMAIYFLFLPCSQLLSIYKKDRQLALEYLEKYYNKQGSDKLPFSHNWNIDYQKVLKQLAVDDPKLYLDIVEKYKLCSHSLGHKATKRIVRNCPDRILVDPYKYSSLSSKALINLLKGEHLEKYLMKPLPKQDSLCYGFQYINYLKPDFRVKMLKKLYALKFDGEIITDYNYFKHFDLTQYVTVEERVNWAKQKINNIGPRDYLKEEDYMIYFTIDEAVPRFQKLIQASEAWEMRSKYLKLMVECCAINNDTDALLNLLKYVNQRHRNDTASLRCEFLTTVSNKFKLHKLSGDHWKILNVMLDFIYANNEIQSNYWYSGVHTYINEFIEYCLINDLDFEPYLEKLFVYGRSGILYDLKVFDKKVMNVILGRYKKMIDEKKDCSSESDVNNAIKYLKEIVSLIMRRKDDFSIVDCPWVVNFIKENHTKWPVYELSSLFDELSKDRKAELMFMEELYHYNLNKNFVLYCLKHRPDLCIDNVKQLVNISVSSSSKISHYSRLYGKIHTYFMNPMGYQIIRDLNKNINDNYENSEEVEKFAISIIFLCNLVSTQETNMLLRKNAPTNLKVDLSKDKDIYKKGEVLGTHIKSINPPVEVATLMAYVGGDYLKFSIGSLLSVAYRKSAKEIEIIIGLLKNEPVSVKKHSVRLMYFLWSRSPTQASYRNFWNEEKHPSMRKVVFQFTLKLLKSERDMSKYYSIWEDLQCFMSGFTENEKDLLNCLCSPKDYMQHIVGEYCENSWSILKRLSAEIDVSAHFSKFLRELSGCLDLLRENFCELLLQECLDAISGKINVKYQPKDLLEFVVNYSLKRKDDENLKHEFPVLSILKAYIISNWNKMEKGAFTHRDVISEFVTKICRQSIKAKLTTNPVHLLKRIILMLQSTLPSDTIFYLIVILNLTIRFKDTMDKAKLDLHSLKDLLSNTAIQVATAVGQLSSTYLKELLSEYGNGIEHPFIKAYNTFYIILFNYDQCNELMLNVISGFLDGSPTRECLILAVTLLQDYPPEDQRKRKLYWDIVEEIKATNDCIANIMLKNKIKQYDTICLE